MLIFLIGEDGNREAIRNTNLLMIRKLPADEDGGITCFLSRSPSRLIAQLYNQSHIFISNTSILLKDKLGTQSMKIVNNNVKCF